MGSVPQGPVIVFRVDGNQVSAGINPAFDEIRAKAKTSSEQIADDWKRMAAQIRASVAQGVLPEKDIASARQQQVASLGREIDLLRNRESLTTKQLSSLKAMTLELERQQSFLKGGAGITTGTSNALNQVSTQTTLGIERMVDSLVNRYLGGAAGALTRTLRDVSYYQSQANGASGGNTGFFGGLSSAFSGILKTVGPATLAIGGFTAAVTAEAAILATVTTKMFAYAQSVENTAAATGLSLQQVQQYSQLAKDFDLDAGSITTAFARINVQLGEIITKGSKANSENAALSRVMKELGVSATDANGQLRPVNAILSDMADAFNSVSNTSARTALELEAFGTRGRVLAQIIEQARNSGESLNEILKEVSKVSLPDAEIQQLAREKDAWDRLKDSIDAAEIHLEGFIATHLKATALIPSLGANGIAALSATSAALGYFTTPSGPGAPQAPTASGAFGQIAADLEAHNKKINDDLLQRAAIIKDGGQAQYELNQAEKNYAEAVKDNVGQDAVRYAQQIENLKTVIDLQKQYADYVKKFNEDLAKGTLNTAHPAIPNQKLNAALRKAGAGTSIQGPDLSNTGLGGASDILASVIGAPSTSAIVDQINKEHDDLFTTQFQKDQQHYEEELNALNFALNQKLISQQQYNDASAKLAQNWAQTQQALNKKYVSDADKLFDDLISGNTKSFSKSLQSDLLNIVTEPFRKEFENLIGGLLGSLNQAINGAGGTSGTGAATGGVSGGGSGTLNLGTILSGGYGTIIKNIFGGGSRSVHSTGTGSGQFGVATDNMNVTAGSVYILSGTNVGGGGSIGLGGSNFFGNNNPFAGSGVFFGNNSPFANAGFGGLKIPGIGGGAGNGPLGGSLGPILGGLILGGTGVASGNVGQEAIGAAVIATAATHALAAAGKLGKNGAAIAGKAGSIFGGTGLIVGGVAQGGASGAVEDIAGGAEFGSAFGPVGAAVGAGVGGLIALGNLIFGNSGWQKSVANAQKNQAVYLPPSENFSFASNGSISSTLGTGFSQSGSSLYQYGINAPFYANAIYGPLTNAQKLELQQQEYGLNSNSPFLNGNASNLFTGVQPRNYRNYPTSPLPYTGNGPLGYSPGSRPAVNVNLNLPGYIDGQSAQAALGPHVNWIAQQVSVAVHSSSSGFAGNVRRAAFLP